MNAPEIYPGSVWTRSTILSTYVAIVNSINDYIIEWIVNTWHLYSMGFLTGPGYTLAHRWHSVFSPAEITRVSRTGERS
jgi:hypothetical protein